MLADQEMKPVQRGLFIVFEGLDRSGKSTQSQRIAKYFKEELQRKVENIQFPNRNTNGGKILNEYLQNREHKLNDKAVHNLFSFNRWEMVPDMIEMLKSGTNLICDRYAFSGVAYSAAKGLDFEWCKNSDNGLPMPDLTFYIDVKPETIQQRGNFGDERYERFEFQAKVGTVYDKFKQDFRESQHWITVDGNSKTMEEITEEILNKITTYENDVMPTVDFDTMTKSLFVTKFEDIKSQIQCFSKAAKTTEQMHSNLQKKEYQDISWSKPKTPEKYLGVKDATAEQVHKVKRNKQLIKENKILSSMFRSIDRETRIKNVDPKLVIPTLNQLGNPPKFWTKDSCKIHFSTLDRKNLEETRRLKELGENEQSRVEYQQGVSQMKRNKSVMSKSINFNASKSRLDMGNDNDDEHNNTIMELRDQLQDKNSTKNPLTIHKQLGQNLNKSQSQKTLPDNSKVNISRFSTLPDISSSEKSIIHPHIMNYKFSRQTNRKPINDNDVNENRFEPNDLFPSSLSKNKKLFWNVQIQKYKERDLTWVERNSPQLSYEQVDLEKFKFNKSYKPIIFSQHNTNKNHHFIVGRPF